MQQPSITIKVRLLGIFLILGLLVSANRSEGQFLESLLKPKPKDERTTEYMVPTRDGVKLSTAVTLPKGEGPWPVVLSRTPYGKAQAFTGILGSELVENGYVRVAQDCRGRFQSEGNFGSFEMEPTDGYDTIEWIAKQPWCNGKVGMFGVSAMGITANFAAMTSPPNLVCTFVCVAHGCDYRFGSYPGGVFLQDLNERWFRTIGAPLPVSPKPRMSLYTEDWARRDMKNNYANVKIPVFNVAGWYDIFSESGMENYEGLHKHGGGNAKGNQKIVMGAFGHFPLNGKLKYPATASKLDVGLVIPWFDHWLKGKQNGIMEEPSCKYFVMGDTFDTSAPGNEWRTADSWPPPATETAYYFVHGGKLANRSAAEGSSITYAYDPRRPVPTVGGNNLFSPRGPMDQREVSRRTDVLRFESEPLEHPVEIVGRVFAELFVGTDVEDTDFTVKLVDVYPDGYEALVLDQAYRLRFREGFDKELRAEKGKTYPVRMNLWSTALVFNKGHKIAVHVSSSNAPRFEPHTNTWTPVDSYADAVVANNVIHVGGQSASRVLLPVTKIYAEPTHPPAAKKETAAR
ncbi:MAG: CocE/NonD family hydrolase [Planctomycetota bacterium]